MRTDILPENDGRLKLEYDGGFGGPLQKERTYEAVKVFRGTDRVRDPPGRRRHPGWQPLPATRGE